MSEGDWKHLGDLQLNQVLDPHTMNAPINPILDRARPYNHGAKPAGAGGGGFRMLLARDPEATGVRARRRRLVSHRERRSTRSHKQHLYSGQRSC
jgi:mevalonate kinase